MFELKNVSVHLGQTPLLSSINLRFKQASISAIIGANGAGKSSLIKCLLGEYPLKSGDVYFNNKSINTYSVKALSKQRAYIAQAKKRVFNILVFEYLLLARLQYAESEHYSKNLIMTTAMEFSITQFLTRDISTLSGGELQLVEFVRAYLQVYESNNMQGKCLLLDEPASALDIKQTAQLYKYITSFKEQGGTAIVIEHDINQVAVIASDIAFLKNGKVLCYGKSEDVFIRSHLDECFEMKGQMIANTAYNSHTRHFYQLLL